MKKTLSIFMILSMLCMSLAFAVCPGGMLGDGSIGNECQVTNWAQLQSISQGLNNNYKLMNNLDPSTPGYGYPFSPIGNSSGSFVGSFDGQGYNITNLYINMPSSTEPVGLFGVSFGATIKNVGLKGAFIQGYNDVGGLVGQVVFTNIQKVFVEGDISGNDNIGGIIGLGYTDANILNAYVDKAYVTGNLNVGGLVGNSPGYLLNIQNSYSNASVSATTYAGGLVGSTSAYSVIINNSFAAGAVSSSVAGAVIGISSNNPVLNNVYYDVTGTLHPNCVGSGTLAPGSTCTPKNVGGSEPLYFFNKLNQPMPNWDFTTIWLEQAYYDHPVFTYCAATEAPYCSDGIDNDCDSLTDCADSECDGIPPCTGGPSGEEICDGIDNDLDGYIDNIASCCNDSDGYGNYTNFGNVTDRDNYIYYDYCNGDNAVDYFCMNDGASSATEQYCPDGCLNGVCCAATEAPYCSDGIDNDCDGLTDCADSECDGIPPCTGGGPGQPDIPEFSTTTIILVIMIVGLGLALIVRKKK